LPASDRPGGLNCPRSLRRRIQMSQAVGFVPERRARWDGALARALVRVQVRSAWNRMRFGASRHPGRMAALILIVLPALALLATMLLVALGQGFARADGDAEATAMLGVLLTLALLGSFIGAMTASLQSYYLARDFTFLMTLTI